MNDKMPNNNDKCAECGELEADHKPCPGCEACMFEGDGSCDHDFRPGYDESKFRPADSEGAIRTEREAEMTNKNNKCECGHEEEL